MTKIDKFEIKLINTVKKYNMIQPGNRVLVGFSGGKDSVALLYSLWKISNYMKFQLYAFHLNHSLRGEESDADEVFAKSFCKELGVPFCSEKIDVASMIGNSREGVEALARQVRYSAFERASECMCCNKVATAHTSSDNSETLLLSLVRNSNIKCIPPVRDSIIRPLILHSTQEVLDYCKRNELSFVTDSTNADDSYSRNFIRHKIMPEIYEISPSFDRSVSRFADIQRSYVELTQREADKYLISPDPMSLKALSALAEDTAYHNVLFAAVTKYFDISLTFSQLDSLISILLDGTVGARVEISDTLCLKRGYNNLELVRTGSKTSEVGDYEFVLKLGKNPIPGTDMVLWLEAEDEYKKRNKDITLNKSNVYKLSKNILIKYNIINRSLVARSRKTGDSFVFCGVNKSVKKFMIDKKIPSEIRNCIPVICDDLGILCVPGLGVADRCRSGAGQAYSLSLEYENNDS